MQIRRDLSASAVMGTFAGASMVPALMGQIAAEGHGITMTFVAWWSLVLLLCVPALHLWPGALGHGGRALTLLVLTPVLAMLTSAAIGWSRTAPWGFVCGTPFVGVMFLPILGGTMVAGAHGAVWGLARMGVLRPLGFVSGACAVVLVGTLAAILVTTEPAPDADARLRADVHAIGVVPDVVGQPMEVAGSRVVRTCDADDRCRTTIDGIEADQDLEGPLEVAEGLGYRFLRPVGSEPREWLTYRPGAAYGTQLDTRSLPGRVAAPAGLGRVLAVTALLACLYALAALAHAPRIARLRRTLPAWVVQPGTVRVAGLVAACDVSVPIGPAIVLGGVDDVATYRARPSAPAVRAGERAVLIDAEWRGVGEHCAMIAALLLLGATPVLVALGSGLVVGW